MPGCGGSFHVETALVGPAEAGYSASVMPLRSLPVALVAALLGAAIALGVAKETGWLGATTNATYVVKEQVRAAPAAVRSVARPLAAGFAPARIYAQRSPGVVTVLAFFAAPKGSGATESQGSGFVVSRSGVILTNSHVITTAGDGNGAPARPAREVFVEFADGDRVPAKIVGWDVFDDVGAIRVDPRQHSVSPVPLGDSSRVVVGEPVAAIGSPFGNTDSLSVGVVSAMRSITSLTSNYDVVDAIQTDAPINHGNSGGPLFDAAGRVIGINAQIRGNGGTAGIGFAIPINAAQRSLAQLLAKGRVAYAYAGIGTDDLNPGIARKYGFPVLHGAIVDNVEPGSAAARAGLRTGGVSVTYAGQQLRLGGDVIVAIGGVPIGSAGDVVRVIGERLEPGQVVRFTLYRGTKRLVIPVRLDRRPLR
jgi:2-alkenal reductase